MSNMNSKPYLVATPPKGAEKKQTINSVPYLIQFEEGSGIGYKTKIVDELPEVGENGIIYLIPNGGSSSNIYDEYLWVEDENKFEKVGTTEVIPPEVVQETGQSMTAVMSQKAVTDELTGKQAALIAGENIIIDDNVISAEGGAKVLTSADYNYPANNPTSVALWLLDDGMYVKKDASVSVRLNTDTLVGGEERTFVIGQYGAIGSSTSKSLIIISSMSSFSSGNDSGIKLYTGTASYGFFSSPYNILSTYSIQDNLTSSSTTTPLSAKQGKALKDLVDSLISAGAGAPTTSTVGIVGKIYEDTTTGDVYHCTAVSGSTYTWEKIGSGGGEESPEIDPEENSFDVPTSADISNNTLHTSGIKGSIVSTYFDVDNNSGIDIVQSTGDSELAVMSQDATTKAINNAGVVILTLDDCNYPESNPKSIALWTLDNGIYTVKDLSGFYISKTRQLPAQPGMMVKVLGKSSVQVHIEITEISGTITNYVVNPTTGDEVGSVKFLDSGDVLSSTGTSTSKAMSQKAVTDELARIPTVVSTTGQSTTSVMNQKAVTDIVGNVEALLQTLNSGGGAQ